MIVVLICVHVLSVFVMQVMDKLVWKSMLHQLANALV